VAGLVAIKGAQGFEEKGVKRGGGEAGRRLSVGLGGEKDGGSIGHCLQARRDGVEKREAEIDGALHQQCSMG